MRIPLATLLLPALQAQEATCTRTADVVYGRKFGTAPAFDV